MNKNAELAAPRLAFFGATQTVTGSRYLLTVSEPPGFQAGGTRGASLVAGAKTIRIHGQNIPVNAEVLQLSSMSAHADGSEIVRALLRPSAPQTHH